MATKPSRHIVALISLLVFLLTGQAGVQGYVWCLGEDGHTNLEYAAGDTCGPELQQRQGCGGEILEAPTREEHCGPCLDMPAFHDATVRTFQNSKDFPSHAGYPAAVRVPFQSSFIRVLTSNLHPQPPPRTSQAILSHRTVVLLN